MELLAEGRTAEVFAYGAGRVLKLDRPDWNGLSTFEAAVLVDLAGGGIAGGPGARHRHGGRAQRRRSWTGSRVRRCWTWCRPRAPSEIDRLAGRFVALQLQCNAVTVGGLPELVPRLRDEIEASVPDAALRAELLSLLAAHDDGGRGVCHFDFHPSNVLIGPDGWVVIDWLTVAAGPSAADLARTLVLWGQRSTGSLERFLPAVRREGLDRRGLDDDALDAWVRVAAAARVAEGFEGEERAWLLRVAGGSERLFA